MQKLWLIAKSNMKKRKGNIVTLFLLVVIAVVLMYSSINVLTSVQGFLKEKNEKQNGAHVAVLATPNYEDKYLDIIQNIEHYESVEAIDKAQTMTTCDITNTTLNDGKKDNMMMLFGKIDESNKISDWKVVNQAEERKENSIVLPMYLKVAKGYQTGDEIKVKINHTTYTFTVYGFTEDVMFATPSNITIYTCQVTDNMFDKLIADGSAKAMLQYNIRLDSVANSQAYEGILQKENTSEMTEPDFGTWFVVNFTSMLGGTTMMINIIMAILAVFSVVMVLIVILVIRFNMMMYLQENLPNVGIMEAGGYTTKQLKCAMLIEYFAVCIIGIIAGLAVACLSSAFVSNLVSGSIGLTWTPEFGIWIAFAVGAFIILFVTIIVLRTGAKLKKITTLDALRGGIETHNFKKNHMPLEKGNLGLHTKLGLKSLLHNTKQNIAVIIIVSLLSFACVLSLLIYYNFAGDSRALLTLVGMEKCDIEVATSERSEEEMTALLDELVARDEIDKGILYGWQGITICNDTDELGVTADVYSDFSKLEIKTIYEGREAERDNELVITTVIADRFHVGVGDSIQVKAGTESKSYIISGVSQQISNMGVRARMTKGGAKRLYSEFGYSGIDLYVKKGNYKTADVVDTLKEEYKSDTKIRISNIDESFETIMGTFSDSLILMCAVFVVITVIVVVMIILMIMRMKMVRERKNIGVYKALGYTTKQIVWQMIMAFAPIVTIGGIIGAALGAISVNKLFVVALSFCQIKNAALALSVPIIAVCILTITACAFVVTTLVAASAKRIEPYKMIVEE